jgi:hypothetical protein
MAGGGGSGGGVESYLPVAAALAATVMTDGAAAPLLTEELGATGAAAVMGGGIGALTGGGVAALTGQDVLKNTLMGGIGGAALGYGGLYSGAGDIAAGAPTTLSASGAPVSGAVATADTSGITAGSNALLNSGASLPVTPGAELGTMTPQALSQAVSNGALTQAQADLYGAAYTNAFSQVPANAVLGGAGTAAAGGMGFGTKAALGGLGLAALMSADNKKYGTPSSASLAYNGPLNQLHYDPKKYTPSTTPQPNPAYQPQYANYVANPYNAYAAEGGHVVAMAGGGIADANNGATPPNPPPGGPIEQMSRDNALGQNQMFPQSSLQTNAFSNPTNTPMGSNMIAPSGDTNVDPYTGAEKFARGGIASVKRYDGGGNVTPDQITSDSVNRNNALMQQLQGALNTPAPQMNPGQVAQQAPLQANPSGMALQQTPYQAPPMAAPAQSHQNYFGAPSFTRTAVPNIEFGNAAATIPGSAAYAKKAADATKAAEDASGTSTFYTAPNGQMWKSYDAYQSSQNGGGSGGGKAGGLMPNDLRYAAGGNVPSLGGYAAGGNPRLLKGPGDGMSDNIPAMIGHKQPARLADGEFVVPADVVSHLGNGSTDAGAKRLYSMMDKVRKARTGNKKQGKQINADKYLPK